MLSLLIFSKYRPPPRLSSEVRVDLLILRFSMLISSELVKCRAPPSILASLFEMSIFIRSNLSNFVAYMEPPCNGS